MSEIVGRESPSEDDATQHAFADAGVPGIVGKTGLEKDGSKYHGPPPGSPYGRFGYWTVSGQCSLVLGASVKKHPNDR